MDKLIIKTPMYEYHRVFLTETLKELLASGWELSPSWSDWGYEVRRLNGCVEEYPQGKPPEVPDVPDPERKP